MINNINNLFDKIYIITVESTGERIASIEERFPDLKYTLFNGIDGTKLFPGKEHPNQFPKEFFSENEVVFDKFSGKSGGQLGCSMSHQCIYKDVIANQYQKVLILEDDSFLNKAHWNEVAKVMSELPPGWGLCYFGYADIVKFQRSFLSFFMLLYHRIKRNKMYNIEFGKYPGRFYPRKYGGVLKGGVFLGTYAYAISFEGAKKLHEQTIPLKYLADELLMEACYHGWLESFASKNPLIHHSNNYKSSQ